MSSIEAEGGRIKFRHTKSRHRSRSPERGNKHHEAGDPRKLGSRAGSEAERIADGHRMSKFDERATEGVVKQSSLMASRRSERARHHGGARGCTLSLNYDEDE